MLGYSEVMKGGEEGNAGRLVEDTEPHSVAEEWRGVEFWCTDVDEGSVSLASSILVKWDVSRTRFRLGSDAIRRSCVRLLI